MATNRFSKKRHRLAALVLTLTGLSLEIVRSRRLNGWKDSDLLFIAASGTVGLRQRVAEPGGIVSGRPQEDLC